RVRYRTQQEAHRDIASKLIAQVRQPGLIGVQDGELGGSQPRNLAAELTADGSRCPGNEDAPPLEFWQNEIEIGRDFTSAQQVRDGHVNEWQRTAPGYQFVQVWNDQQLDAGLPDD